MTLETVQGSSRAVREILGSGWSRIEAATEKLRSCRRVFLSGSGTSYHAAWAGSYLFRGPGSMDSFPLQAFELAQYPLRPAPGDAVVVLSHSGSKRFSKAGLELARESGALTIAVTGKGARLDRADFLFETVEQERSSAHTAGYLGSLTVLAQLAYSCGQGTEKAKKALAPLPKLLDEILARASEAEKAASQVVSARRVVTVGGGPHAATASEAALKLMEMAHLPAQSFELETFLHGPMTALEKEDLVLLAAVPGPSWNRSKEAVRAVKEIGCPIWRVGGEIPKAEGFRLPEISEELSPILAVVPFQLLAHRSALLRSLNPDLNRKDQEPYRRAFESYAS